VNEQGFIDVVPPNTRRFNHDPMTLQPLGLLLEPEAKNLITESDITKWVQIRVNVTSTISIFANPVYFVQGNGVNNQHYTRLPIPTVSFDKFRMLSIYMKNATNRFAQVTIGGDVVFVNFDLELGVLGTKHNSAQASIVPTGDGWCRCSMTFTSPLGLSFLVYLVTAADAIRDQGNSTTGSIFVCFPQLELG
jgi:hypothetical protein